MQVQYDTHLPALSLQDRENLRTLLVGVVLPTLHSHVLCKNWHLCAVCWGKCKHKKSHVPTPPEVGTTIARLLKNIGEIAMSA